MDKPLKDWTLEELNKYCVETKCKGCAFKRKNARPTEVWCPFSWEYPIDWNLQLMEVQNG